MEILAVIFSRDRAMQLDATLRSLFLHCRDANDARISVIYKTTTHAHRRRYDQLKKSYCSVNFIEQTNFRRDLLELLVEHCTQHPVSAFRRWSMELGPVMGRLCSLRTGLGRECFVLFLVDDNLFVRDFHLREVQEMLEANPRALGFSLRLGTNTRYCYPLDRTQVVPPLTYVGGGVMIYNWADAGDSAYDFGYPLEVSSSTYRVSEVFPFLSGLAFENPNTLEGGMAANVERFRSSKPDLLCYERSVTFCTPLNRVQTVWDNRIANAPEYSTERLAEIFDEGHRIDVEAYSGFVPNGCHEEVRLAFRKRVTDSQGA